MSKRKLNVSVEHKEKSHANKNSAHTESEDGYDSENELPYEPIGKRTRNVRYKSNSFRARGKSNFEEQLLLKENSEHSYSCNPFFTNMSHGNSEVNEKFDSSEGSYESDGGDDSYSGKRISERSTSTESIKCGKGKSLPNMFGSQNSKRKNKCSTKNAVMARMNRLRKKEYVANLEGNIKTLKESNCKLKSELQEQQVRIASLKTEVQYLKNVISNSNEIGVLLHRICGRPNDRMKISSSLLCSSPQQENFFTDEPIKGTDECLSSYFSDNLSDISPGLSDENICDSGFYQLSDDICNLSFFTPLDSNDWQMSSNYDLNEIDKLIDLDAIPSGLDDLPSCDSGYGVCLHVANKQVSLEFCATCNKNASSVLNSDFYSSSVK